MRRAPWIAFARLCRFLRRITGIEEASKIRSHAMAQSREASRQLSEAADGAMASVDQLLRELNRK